jgi:paraquat-inducible protein A
MERVEFQEDSTEHICHVCGNYEEKAVDRCSRCGAIMKGKVVQPALLTLSLLLTSMILYIPANVLPVMVTYQFGKPTESTIIGGVVSLWHYGDYVIASIIFIASVVVPLAKIIALTYLAFTSIYQDNQCPIAKTHLYHATEMVGKWSMVDVFVVVILVTLIQIGSIVSIQSGPGIISFAAVVVLTMIAAIVFDTRLLWESHDNKPRKHEC